MANSSRWLRPNTWQGWAYAIGWVAALVLPSFALVARDQAPEAAIWMLLSTGLWLWDAAAIRKANRSKTPREVFYIGDDAETSTV